MGVGAVPSVCGYLTLLCQHLGVFPARLLGRGHLLVDKLSAKLGTPLVNDLGDNWHGSAAALGAVGGLGFFSHYYLPFLFHKERERETGARDAGVCTHARMFHVFHLCFACKPASLLVFHFYS